MIVHVNIELQVISTVLVLLVDCLGLRYIGVEVLELGINKCAYNFVYFAMTVWNDNTENTLKAESVHVNILCSQM